MKIKVSRKEFTDAFILSSNPITDDNDAYYQNRYILNNEVFKQVVEHWLNK